IQNPAEPQMVQQIKDETKDIVLENLSARKLYTDLPKNLNLGDLTIPYSSFLTNIKQLADYQEHKLFDKQAQSLSNILKEQRSALQTLREKEELSKENIQINKKFLQ